MKRILALNFFPAFVPVSNGGESRLYNFYRVLSKHHHITLLTSTYPNVKDEIVYHTSTFIERRIPKDAYFHKCWEELSVYLADGHGDLSAPALTANGSYPSALHNAYLQEYDNADIVIHDSPFTIDFDIFIGTDRKPRIYNSYNCETELYNQLHISKKSKPIVDLVANAEKRLLEYADLILYCGEGDFSLFKKIVPHKESVMRYSPNGMTEQYGSTIQKKREKRHSAVFVGSAHLPNVKAAKYIAEVIAPQCTNVDFDIIGNCLPEGKYVNNVKRHGRVSDDDKVRLFSQASIALNPMDIGSGSNIKALDYFSYALPILSTPFGMRGFDINHGIHYIEGELTNFPKLIKFHLSKKEYCKTMDIGLAGKQIACEKYTWEAIVSNLLPELEQLTHDAEPYTLVLNDYNSFSSMGGGGTRTKGLYQAVNHISPVVFVCFSDNDKLTRVKYNSKTTIISIPKTIEHKQEVKELNSQFHISSDDIIASKYCISNYFLGKIYNTLKKYSRFIIVEHPYMSPLPMSFGDRFIYSSQNDETKLKRALLEWHPKKQYLIDIVAEVEKHAVEKSAVTVAVSDDDAYSLLSGKQTAGSMVVVRNGAQLPVLISENKNNEVTKKIKSKSAVFLGSAHMPNVDAVNYLLKEVAPKCPDVQFNIVGSVCDAVSVKLPNNVILWGIVDEETKCAILQNCLIAVNPVISGSGSNVKLADFFANGLFVISSKFGLRGYPDKINKHVITAELIEFPNIINSLSVTNSIFDVGMKQERKNIFLTDLSMVGLAAKFVRTLERLEKPKRKVLFVTYRYTHPELGGAEAHLKRFLKALGESDEFEIDAITTEVSKASNYSRFMEHYAFDKEISAPIEMYNLRFARFPIEAEPTQKSLSLLNQAWQVQPLFERAIVERMNLPFEDTLAWGWGHVEDGGAGYFRWGYTSCALNITASGLIQLNAYAPEKSLITFQSPSGAVYLSKEIDGHFTIEIQVEAGLVEIITSKVFNSAQDPRPLAFILYELRINNVPLHLNKSTLADPKRVPANEVFDVLSEAAEMTRFPLQINLTDMRGPHSVSMENYISSNVDKYDLVITHNIVFKPAVFAIEAAKANGIPTILIPHAHLDDDYYHFPDLLHAARQATRVLAVPKAAANFYKIKGCNSTYLPAGADTDELFLEKDRQAFKEIYTNEGPFILVLGRKSGAKGYREIIDAVETVNHSDRQLKVVMIGPDDDGVAIKSQFVTYLARQPRNIVRGALMSCLALVNMSSSESFGIVLLEAWLAKKPVIVNQSCVAFHDMASHEKNALMVAPEMLPDALIRILDTPELCEQLGENGFITAQDFSWNKVENEFVNICRDVLK